MSHTNGKFSSLTPLLSGPAWLATILILGFLRGAIAAEPGSSVVVVYNSKMAESKRVAEHYAQKRQVPKNQVLGFALPETESMTRFEFVDRLEKPLLKELE
jgi:hypothetical protein